MPWPDFTELTFGYAYLRELERKHMPGGTFPMAPDFISQSDEATKGYDVKVMLTGTTPFFIQFKRSFVLTRRTAREVADGYFASPRVYRMHLHKRGAYRQHKALRNLEASGCMVAYVTSQIYTHLEFSRHFGSQTIISDASAHFLPSQISLPNVTEDHHISFKPGISTAYLYSAEPRVLERSLADQQSLLGQLRERRRSYEGNLAVLTKAVELMSDRLGPRSQIAKLLRERPIEQQAALLAYYQLDSILTFVKAD